MHLRHFHLDSKQTTFKWYLQNANFLKLHHHSSWLETFVLNASRKIMIIEGGEKNEEWKIRREMREASISKKKGKKAEQEGQTYRDW